MKDVKLGMDPEFLLIDSRGDVKQASSIINGNYEVFGELGCDGCSTLAEIRPNPSVDPIEVTANIKQILINACIKKPQLLDYRWRAGSWYKNCCLGGHIHFGHADMKISDKVSMTTTILDHILAPLVLLMETKEEASQRRQRGRYGTLHGWRSQKWGFEYRTLPSFIVNPVITNGIMSIAKLIAMGVVNETISQEWRTEMTSTVSVDEAEFNYGNKITFRRGLTRRMSLIRGLKGYTDYKEHIKILYRMIKNGVTFDKYSDLKDSWDITGVDFKEMIDKRKVKAMLAEEVYAQC